MDACTGDSPAKFDIYGGVAARPAPSAGVSARSPPPSASPSLTAAQREMLKRKAVETRQLLLQRQASRAAATLNVRELKRILTNAGAVTRACARNARAGRTCTASPNMRVPHAPVNILVIRAAPQALRLTHMWG